MKKLCLALWLSLALLSSSQAQEILRDLPASIATDKKYIFFQHSLSVEQLDHDSYSKEFRKTYDTTALTAAFAKAGYVVIAEFRPRGSRVPAYADKLSGQIRELLAAGVPARNIGGADARATYEKLIADSHGQLQGRFLAQYDTTDQWMGSCSELQAANPGLLLEETVIQSGYAAGIGHSLFYTPETIWFAPLLKWLGR